MNGRNRRPQFRNSGAGPGGAKRQPARAAATTGTAVMPAKAFWLLALACFPAYATYLTFFREIHPQTLYPLSKILMLLGPILVWRLQEAPGTGLRAMSRLAGLRTTKGAAGFFSGLLLGATICGTYAFVFAGRLDPSGVLEKLSSLNLGGHYLEAALFIALANSALEEWFWRGFLYERSRRLGLAAVPAVVLNGLFFGLHHYFVLQSYFPGGTAVFLTAATMIAGAFWAFMRSRGASLVDCFLSHALADAAILAMGWNLLYN